MKTKTFYQLGFIILLGATLFLNSAYTQPANSPWPMYQHDAQHTGLSPYVGPKNPKLAWRFETPGDISTGVTIDKLNRIFFASFSNFDSRYYALKPSGVLDFEFSIGNGSTAALAEDGTIYISYNKSLYAFECNGQLKWQYEISLPKYSGIEAPIIGEDGTIFFTGGHDLYALYPNGNLKWKFSSGQNLIGVPSLDSQGNVYVGDLWNDRLYSIDANGQMRWNVELGSWPSSPTIAGDSLVYIVTNTYKFLGNWDTKLHAVYLTNGSIKWSKPFGNNAGNPSIGPDGNIYVGSEDSILYAFNTNGIIKWKYKTEGKIKNLIAIDSNGTMYFGSNDSKLYALNSDGSLKWFYQTGGAVGSPSLSDQGILYFGSTDNFLYALYQQPEGHSDLALENLCTDPLFGATNNIDVTITVNVAEQTDSVATKAIVTFYINNTSNPIGSESIFVPAGDSTIAKVIWNTDSFNADEYQVIAEITYTEPEDLVSDNNILTINYPIRPFIQPRIENANIGDTVYVDPGTYLETIILRKDIAVFGTAGPDSTIIDGGEAENVVSAPYLDPTAVLDGFTIVNGSTGINIERGGVTLVNNIIKNNSCGLWMIGSYAYSDPVIKNNLFFQNDGKAIDANNSWAQVYNNTFVENGTGVNSVGFYQPSPYMWNNIYWNNGDDLSGTAKSTFSCIKNGDPGTGNISSDPLFIDPNIGDYHLQYNSPCIDAGDPNSPKDLDRTRADIGAYYFDQGPWRGKILGQILDTINNQPIINARILLSGTTEDATTSDKNGEFIFYPLPDTNYAVSVFAPGYPSATKQGFIAVIGETTHVNFALSQNPLPSALFPPRDLVAQEQEGAVQLSWKTPNEQIALDDGNFEDVIGFMSVSGILANGPYEPATYPLKIEKVRVIFNGEQAGDKFQVLAYLDPSGSATQPSTSLLRGTSVAFEIENTGAFQEVDLNTLNLIVNSGKFFIGIKQLGTKPMWLGLDTDEPDGKAFFDENLDGNFRPVTDANLHGAFGIRAIVGRQGNGGLAKIVLNTGSGSFYELTDANSINNQSGADNVTVLISKKWSNFKNNNISLSKFNLSSYHASLTGYNIYRTSSSPVLVDPNNLINSVAANVTAYNDSTVQMGTTYYYVITAEYSEGSSEPSNEASILVTSIDRSFDNTVPKKLDLFQNYPNPFNPTTTIKYQLSKYCHVSLKIFNALGQEVTTLVDKHQNAGFYSMQWDATGQASGLYFYILKAEEFTKARKIILLR